MGILGVFRFEFFFFFKPGNIVFSSSCEEKYISLFSNKIRDGLTVSSPNGRARPSPCLTQVNPRLGPLCMGSSPNPCGLGIGAGSV